MDSRSIDITWSGLWKVFALVLVLSLLYLASDVLLAVLLAIILSAAFDLPVTYLEKHKVPRILGTFMLFALAVLVLALIAYTIVPLAIFEVNNFLGSLHKTSGTIFDILQSSQAIEALNKSLNSLSNALISGSTSLIDIVANFLGGAFLALSVFVLSFYLTLGRDGVEKFLVAVVPEAYEDVVLATFVSMRKKIGYWLEGQVFLSFGMGVSVFLGLWLLGVKYSLVLGILAGILELVPFVGPIFSGSMAVLVATGSSMTLAIYTLFLFIVLQQLESHVLVPAVTRYTTSLHPVAVLIALLIGGKIFGFVGLILAVPVAVFAQELMEGYTQTKAKRRSASA